MVERGSGGRFLDFDFWLPSDAGTESVVSSFGSELVGSGSNSSTSSGRTANGSAFPSGATHGSGSAYSRTANGSGCGEEMRMEAATQIPSPAKPTGRARPAAVAGARRSPPVARASAARDSSGSAGVTTLFLAGNRSPISKSQVVVASRTPWGVGRAKAAVSASQVFGPRAGLLHHRPRKVLRVARASFASLAEDWHASSNAMTCVIEGGRSAGRLAIIA